MSGLAIFHVQTAERLRTHILHMAREQSARPTWHRPYANGKFYIQHFKQARGSAYIARAVAYPPALDGMYEDYCIVLATGKSEEGVLEALENLEHIIEGRRREYEEELNELLRRAKVGT